MLQSYDCLIEHIPGFKNPADSISKRWGGKKLVNVTAKEEDTGFVKILRVKKNASDQDIQKALNQVFGRQKATTGLPEDVQDYGHLLLDDEEVGEDSWFYPSSSMATLAMIRLTVRVDRGIRHAMMDLLRSKSPYDEIIARQESEDVQEVNKGLYKYRLH